MDIFERVNRQQLRDDEGRRDAMRLTRWWVKNKIGLEIKEDMQALGYIQMIEADEVHQEIARLTKQVERLKTMSTVEMMCENVNVSSHVREWEARCLKAEARLAQAEQERDRLHQQVEEYRATITYLEGLRHE